MNTASIISILVFWAPTEMVVQLYLAPSLGFPAHIPTFSQICLPHQFQSLSHMGRINYSIGPLSLAPVIYVS